MRAGKFWILFFLSLVIAFLIGAEIYSENEVSTLANETSYNQAYLAKAQRQNEVLRQLIRRIATDSQSDSALADLLAKHGVHVTLTPRVPTSKGPTSPQTNP